MRDSINAELQRRSSAVYPISWSSYVNPIDADIFNEIRNAVGNNLGTTTPTSSTAIQGTVSAGDLIQATQIETLESKVESIQTQQANDADYEAKIDKIIDYFKL